MSRDSGQTWVELRPALEDSDWVAYTAGFAIRDDHRIDVIALRARLPISVGPTSLVGLQLDDGMPGPVSEIGVFPDGFPEQPVPVLARDSLGEAWFIGFNHAPRVPISGSVGEAVTFDAGILVLRRPGPTAAWSIVDQPAGEVSHRLGRMQDAIGTMGGVSVLADSNAFAVLYEADQPYLMRRMDAYHWAEPEHMITGRKNRDQHPDLRLLFHAPERRGYVAWIDATRQRHSMRFIFIDTWANNDLALSTIRVRADGRFDVSAPVYLTRDLGFVRHLQLLTTGGHDFVVWVGKDRVGKTVESGYHPVELVAHRLN